MNSVRYHTAWVTWQARALAAVRQEGATHTAAPPLLPPLAAARNKARGASSGPVNLAASGGLS